MFFQNFKVDAGFLVCELSPTSDIVVPDFVKEGGGSLKLKKLYIKAPTRTDKPLIEDCDVAFLKAYVKARDSQFKLGVSMLGSFKKEEETQDEKTQKITKLQKEVSSFNAREYLFDMLSEINKFCPAEVYEFKKSIINLIDGKLYQSIDQKEGNTIEKYFDSDDFVPLVNEINSVVSIEYMGFFFGYSAALTDTLLDEQNTKRRELAKLQ